MIDAHSALIYTMVLASAADAQMDDEELAEIGQHIRFLPVFKGFDDKRLPELARDCTNLLTDPEGLDKAFDLIRDALPEKLRETAYALACDIVAADGIASQEELRLLELMRHRLEVSRLTAAAIERGSRARYMRL